MDFPINIPYEEWGNTLRDGAAALAERFEPNKLALQLVERGTALGKKYRRKKTTVALAAGFAAGVGATLIVVGIVHSAKRKKEKLQKTVELLRREPEEDETQEDEE